MNKLSYKWSGPYSVTEAVTPLTYVISDRKNSKIMGAQGIKNHKPYYDRPARLQDKPASSKVTEEVQMTLNTGRS